MNAIILILFMIFQQGPPLQKAPAGPVQADHPAAAPETAAPVSVITETTTTDTTAPETPASESAIPESPPRETVGYMQADMLTLEQAQRLAAGNHPLRSQQPVQESIRDLNIRNLNTRYLPEISVSASAQYQSDVTEIAIPLPEAVAPTQPKDRYSLSLNLNQLIWDGGRTGAARNVEQSYREMEHQAVEVEIYRLREQVNEAYFNVLITRKRLESLDLLASEVDARLGQVRLRVESGAVLQSQADVLEAERVSLRQQRAGLAAAHHTSLEVLSELTGRELDTGTGLGIPDTDQYSMLLPVDIRSEMATLRRLPSSGITATVLQENTAGNGEAPLEMQPAPGRSGADDHPEYEHFDTSGQDKSGGYGQMPAEVNSGSGGESPRDRPEYEHFDLTRRTLENRERMAASQYRPVISGFATTAYSRPGLDIFDDSFSPWYMVGVTARWNIWNWNKSSRERQILHLERKLVDSREQAFVQQISVAARGHMNTIGRLSEVMELDGEIIALRGRIAEQAETRLLNGSITATEYLSELNALHQARLSKSIHSLELARAIINLATHTGSLP